MQSLDKVAIDMFSVVLFDEIHNYGSKRLLPYLSKENFKYKIGLSATIDRYDGKHWKMFEVFNYNIFKYSPKQALLEGVLNDFKFINIGVQLDYDTKTKYDKVTDEINQLLVSGGGFGKIMHSNSGLKFKLYKLMGQRKEMVNNYVRKFEVAKQICDKHNKAKIIIFNEFNAQTNKLYWHLLDSNVKACVMHSGLPKEKREENLTKYKNDFYNVILATKILDEGYNVPSIDVGIIMAGNSTAKQTIQRLGRCLRKKDKCSYLYQIYCIDTIEEEQAIERAKTFKDLAIDYKDINFKLDVAMLEV
jgi:superfamily II DNA or RNA helicase